jgi:electron transfer flavoprotein alpha subunit
MTKNILFVAHVDETGTALPKAAYDGLGAAIDIASQLGGMLTIGLVGGSIQDAANSIATSGAKILGVAGQDFVNARYGSDAAAIEALCKAACPEIVVAPGTSRLLRVMPGVAQRLKGCVDTHITSLEVTDGALTAKRWFYRQRLEGLIQRDARPWVLVVESGCHAAWSGAVSMAEIQMLDVPLNANSSRTSVTGVRAPKSGAQTIRLDARLLFVAGAGWTKKQTDGKSHVSDAESLILEFLRDSGASLGGSKSLVDQSGENQTVLSFMTHLNQVGQTGSTPHHPKGLSTCCHGEEPHVVGWRFINERRAINLDPNCGWARGKADVLYVADAFQVMKKLNELLAEKASRKEETAATSL